MKKITALILALMMVFAAAGALGEVFSGSVEGISNSAALEGYLRKGVQETSGGSPQSFPRMNAVGTRLSGSEKKLYDLLRPQIVKAAAGKISSTRFSFPLSDFAENVTYSLSELGCSASDREEVIMDAFFAKAGVPQMDSLTKAVSALLADMPYELYWFDKTVGWSLSMDFGVYEKEAGKRALWNYDEGAITVGMTVAKEFSGSGETGKYTLNTTLAKNITDAAENIKSILQNNRNKNDYDKLKAYRDWIRSHVEYNDDAARDDSMPYGNPWQLIWVFDNDDKTKVVCEGYSKAFKYLCDCSKFSGSTSVICVSGDMSQMPGGAGAHMWNLVTMNDGKRYMTDVTNDGSGNLFLAGYSDSRELWDGRTAYLYGSYWYVYSKDTLSTFSAKELAAADGSAYSGTGNPDESSSAVWKDPVYTWAEDHSSVTALRESATDPYATVLETVSAAVTSVRKASCLEAEKTTYASEGFMNEAFTAQTETADTAPALGHDWGETAYTWNKDHTQVTASRTCRRDGTHKETETVSATSAVAAAPACEQMGKTTYTGAAFQNPDFVLQEITVTDIPAAGHDWGNPEYTWGAENKTVTAVRVCRRDGTHTETETVNAAGSVTKAPTCTEKGETAWTGGAFQNKAFSAQTKTEETGPLGHDWGETVYTWNEDHTQVTALRVCRRDASHTETETVGATAAAAEASCEQAGKTTYTGAAFENSAFAAQEITLENIPATGHDWGEPEYTWGAENKTLTAVRVCRNDETHTETETVSAAGVVLRAPTTTEEGETVWTSGAFANEAFAAQTKTEITGKVKIPVGKTGWVKNSDGTWSYGDADGNAVIGVMRDGGTLYCFDEKGVMATGWAEVDGTWYYAESTGALATGWKSVGGAWYYFRSSGEMVTGWIRDGGEYYYMTSGGRMATGWIEDDGEWYYLQGGGTMKTGWAQVDGSWYYFNSDGRMATGWIRDGGTYYYMKSSGAMATGWIEDGGKWYYLQGNGAMKTGWLQDGNRWYFLKPGGEMATGWHLDGKNWYYFKDSGAMAEDWQRIGGKWYYFKDGVMQTGWFEDREAEKKLPAGEKRALWYWFDESGAMATGWKEIKGQWEMFAENGEWLYTWDGN